MMKAYIMVLTRVVEMYVRQMTNANTSLNGHTRGSQTLDGVERTNLV